MSFELEGGREAAWNLIDSTQLMSITVNLCDIRTTITHPYTTAHARWSEADKAQAGITEDNISNIKQTNDDLSQRNEQLHAEVMKLKEGKEALEERARSQLGFIKDGEVFYRVVPKENERLR